MRLRLFIHTTAWWCFMGILLFGAAGTFRWAAGWVFLAEAEVMSVLIGNWLARHDPGLLEERMKFPVRREQPGWDRFLMSLFMTLFVAWLALMAVDANRLGWWRMPVWAQVSGALGVAMSNLVGWQVFKVNSFAAPVVRLQSERRHSVITTGVYAYVRHPMYAGSMFLMFGLPLLLGSWIGLMAAPLLVLLFSLRIIKEEELLRRELEGYEDYARRVRWRLIPYVW
jgi:protein-S-isoprenylcysteine O-methyltransferase Ste14